MKDNIGFFKSLLGGRRGRSGQADSMQLTVIGTLIQHSKRGEVLRDDVVHLHSLSRATADRLLGGMERDGLITCQEGSDGHRRIALTGAGYTVYQKAMNQIWNLDLDPAKGPDSETLDNFCGELGDSADAAV